MQSQTPLPSPPAWSTGYRYWGDRHAMQGWIPRENSKPSQVPHTFLDKQPDPSSEKVSRAMWAPYLLELLGGCNLLSAGLTGPTTMEVHWSDTPVNRATNLYRCKVLVV